MGIVVLGMAIRLALWLLLAGTGCRVGAATFNVTQGTICGELPPR